VGDWHTEASATLAPLAMGGEDIFTPPPPPPQLARVCEWRGDGGHSRTLGLWAHITMPAEATPPSLADLRLQT
jgi:hypothetical protein